MRFIITDHAHRYPRWTLADLYKLIHQAALGSEHALANEPQARDWLMRELAQLGPGLNEPLLDPISPDGRIVRLHLRPFAQLQLDAEGLVRAFILTAQTFSRDTQRLREYAALANQLAHEGVLPFSPQQVSRYMAKAQALDFPAIHHSVRYREDYHPAYRVVAREMLPPEIVAIA